MKTQRTELGALEARIDLTIEPSDYKGKFDEAVKKYSKTATLKGFRKGMAPVNTIRKMFGKNLLAEVIVNLVDKGLDDYLKTESIQILGHPIPSENHPQIDFSLSLANDYTFSYDIGIHPEIDLSGTAAESNYDDYQVSFGDKEIDEEMDSLRRRFGVQQASSEAIEERDILIISIIEEGEPEGREPFTNEIKVMPSSLTEEYKAKVMGQKTGCKFQFDIFKLEENLNEETVRKLFLKEAPEEVGHLFEAKVMEVTRLAPAELNEEFFKNAFGEEVKTEEEARQKISDYIGNYYKYQGEAISKRMMLQRLVDENEFELPDAFLKRWLLSNNENLTAEEVEKDYSHFVKDIRWSLIKGHLARKFSVEITREDIKGSLIRKFQDNLMRSGYGQFGGLDLNQIAENAMKQQKTVEKEYEELLSARTLDALYDLVKLTPKELSIEEYKEMVQKLNVNHHSH